MAGEVRRIDESERAQVVGRGRLLTGATLAYNLLEGLLSVGAGLLAGSVALVGFGIDSFIELSASIAAIWRLRVDADRARRERAEARAQRLIGLSFLALALAVGYEAVRTLTERQAPEASTVGIVVAAVSLIVMPLLARAKRRVAAALGSGALHAEARQTEICTILSALLLAGLAARAGLGWWWADPVAALAMTPWIAWEGVQGIRGRQMCADCAPIGIGPDPDRGRPQGRSGGAASDRGSA